MGGILFKGNYFPDNRQSFFKVIKLGTSTQKGLANVQCFAKWIEMPLDLKLI